MKDSEIVMQQNAQFCEIAIVKNYLQTLPPDSLLKVIEDVSGTRASSLFQAYWTALGQKFSANLKLETPELSFDNPELEKAINAARDYYWQLTLTCVQASEEAVFPNGMMDFCGGVGGLMKLLIFEDLLKMADLLTNKSFLTPTKKNYQELEREHKKWLTGKNSCESTLKRLLKDYDSTEIIEKIEEHYALNIRVFDLFRQNRKRLKNYKALCEAIANKRIADYRRVLLKKGSVHLSTCSKIKKR